MASLAVPSLFSVRGKVALVTGGSTGLGFMMASALVLNGAHVLIASRKQSSLEKAVAELNKSAQDGGQADFIVADLGSAAGCDSLVAEVKRRCPAGLDILVNNSGTTWGAPLTDFPEKQGWDRVMATNVKAIFYTSAGLAELLEKRATSTDPGRIVNITSVAGISPLAEGTGLSAGGVGECFLGLSATPPWPQRSRSRG